MVQKTQKRLGLELPQVNFFCALFSVRFCLYPFYKVTE
ncbi:hypothetical protein SR187_3170 [Streptococcus ruminantium]|uniref:Uncharacterized protein n=1 Tax=Streptococcus ruminantium TaxID=1917441 RepID=A0A2Z5U314_9STRE|nr:hypothetical protein SR187_3170 [Streptococcus ruminantium]